MAPWLHTVALFSQPSLGFREIFRGRFSLVQPGLTPISRCESQFQSKCTTRARQNFNSAKVPIFLPNNKICNFKQVHFTAALAIVTKNAFPEN